MNIDYSKPGCHQCKFTHLTVERAGILFAVVDLSTNDAVLEYI